VLDEHLLVEGQLVVFGSDLVGFQERLALAFGRSIFALLRIKFGQIGVGNPGAAGRVS
jgi:hypothetical protein